MNPLWMPKGSVRAIIVFVLILPVPILLLRYGFMHEEIPSSVKDVILVLTGFIFKIIEAYFTSRDTEAKPVEKETPSS